MQYVQHAEAKRVKGTVITRSVMVSHMPDELKTDKQFHQYWDSLYPNRVAHTVLEPDLRNLEKLINNKKKLDKKLEDTEKKVHT
jgi:hypothetical protein